MLIDVLLRALLKLVLESQALLPSSETTSSMFLASLSLPARAHGPVLKDGLEVCQTQALRTQARRPLPASCCSHNNWHARRRPEVTRMKSQGVGVEAWAMERERGQGEGAEQVPSDEGCTWLLCLYSFLLQGPPKQISIYFSGTYLSVRKICPYVITLLTGLTSTLLGVIC